MGFLFGRKSKPRKTVETTEMPGTSHLHAPAAQALNVLVNTGFSTGSFLQSLDQNHGFETDVTHDGLEIAEQSEHGITCVMADRIAGFSVAGVDPAYLASVIVDPIVMPIFGQYPNWNTPDPVSSVWTAQIASTNGIVALLECKERPIDTTIPKRDRFGATLTIQMVTQH